MARRHLIDLLVAALLRSTLHGLFDGSTLLITVRGRRSGWAFSTPVGYVRDADDLLILSWRERTW